MKIKSLIMLTIMAVISLNSWAMDSDEISIPKKNETNMCSFEYKDFAKYSAIFTEHFTFGLSSLIPDILEDTCSENDKMTEAGIQIDTLKGQIEEVKNELTHMGYNQGALWEKMGKIVNDMYLTPYTTALRDFDEYVTGYQSVFNGYGSLLEYSRKAVNDKNEVLGFKKLYVRNRTFASKFTETALLIQKLQGILPLEPNARKIAENLHSMCYDAKSIHGEVFETRKECNVIVRDMLLNITLRVAIAKKILADEINTINEAMRINNIDQKWIDSIGIGKFNYTEEQKNYYIDWINALQIANKITDKYSEDIKTILAGKDNEKLFPLLKDFPSELSDSMPNKFCYNSTKLKTGNYRFDPAILAWYPNGKENNNLANGVEPAFIITKCFDRINPDKRVQAKYYLAGGNQVQNWMGVLVPSTTKAKAVITQTPISIATNVSGNFTQARFELDSSYPLKVNSISINSYYAPGKMFLNPLPDFMKVDLYEPIDPAYFYKNTYYSLEQLSGTSKPSSFLQPLTFEDGTKSTTKFVSNIWNINSASINPTKTENGSQINATVFLSFEMNKFTYLFGLEISNTGAAQERVKGPDGSGLVNHKPKQTISLACVTDTQCTVSGNQIIWNDGTYASFSGSDNKINLSFGNK